MDFERSEISEGMLVVGSDGDIIGRVKTIGDADFSIDQLMQVDVALPLTTVKTVSGLMVALTITSGEVQRLAWEQASLAS